MIQPESLVQLVGSGNTATVEEEWLRVVEAPDLPLAQLAGYHTVLAELSRRGRTSHAESLAWTAIETIAARCSPQEALRVAGAFLQGIGESKELRTQVVKLYRDAYENGGGVDGLLAIAGLEGGRPVRRALRILEVCLPLQTGDFLRSRDDDGAARVERVDRTSWSIDITTQSGDETLDAIQLSDRYQRADATDFRVMRWFSADQLMKKLQDDPLAVLIDFCRQHGNKIDTDRLEAELVPTLLTASEWGKWWTKARAAAKQSPNLKVEGRSPYVVHYVEAPTSPDASLRAEFNGLRDPFEQLEVVEKYLRECKLRKEQPSESLLRHCYDAFRDRARRLAKDGAGGAGIAWLMARFIGEEAGFEDAAKGSVDFFRSTAHPGRLLAELKDDSLVQLALESWIAAKPDEWQSELRSLLPTLSLSACDFAAQRLIAAGMGPSDFDPVIQQILAQPVRHFDALLWLYDGPTQGDRIASLSTTTILTRIIRTLEECRRSDHVPKEFLKVVQARSRTVLSARRYERFLQCLDLMDAGMAAAIRTQLARLDNLSKAVRDDLIRHIRTKYPTAAPATATALWARADILFVTSEGLSRKQDEIEQHVNVKMRENAKAIGAAAERGDLSENSEYKFALEERDLLKARLAQMNAEVAMAKVIDPDGVPTDQVGIGSRVVFRRVTDGERYDMTFVGPWESDPVKRWFNYKAPLAQKIMDKRIGDVIDFDHGGIAGSYEIVELHNALTE